MSLNIKNEHVHDLVRKASERTGLSQTSVVERAMEELLARLDDDIDERERRIDELVAEIQRLAAEPGGRLLTDDDLYDEMGLPK